MSRGELTQLLKEGLTVKNVATFFFYLMVAAFITGQSYSKYFGEKPASEAVSSSGRAEFRVKLTELEKDSAENKTAHAVLAVELRNVNASLDEIKMILRSRRG